MTFSDWLTAEKGRAASIAARFGVSASAVSQWKTTGVPLVHMKAVRDVTGGVVTLDEMVPDTPAPATEAECTRP